MIRLISFAVMIVKCDKTQLDADLYALAVHPDEHYAKTYVPASTKLVFMSMNRKERSHHTQT